MFKLLVKKQKGEGDLVASLFAILALTMVVYFFIGAIGDVTTRTEMDQVARKYILRMESTGELTADDKKALYTDLYNIRAIKDAVDNMGGKIEISWGSSAGTGVKGGYGSTITLNIKCTASVLRYTNIDTNGNNAGFMGLFGKTTLDYNVSKQSTAKY